MRSHIVLAALVGSFPAAVAELDFTPRAGAIGGGLAERVYFEDGGVKFAVTTDRDTQTSFEEGAAVFRFANLPRANFRIGKSPQTPALAFGPQSASVYLKLANSLLPSGAENRVLIAQAADVFPVNQWKSQRFIFSHVLAGVPFEESITFLNLDARQQIVLRTAAPKPDFAAATERADDIIRRWHQVLPGDEIGAN